MHHGDQFASRGDTTRFRMAKTRCKLQAVHWRAASRGLPAIKTVKHFFLPKEVSEWLYSVVAKCGSFVYNLQFQSKKQSKIDGFLKFIQEMPACLHNKMSPSCVWFFSLERVRPPATCSPLAKTGPLVAIQNLFMLVAAPNIWTNWKVKIFSFWEGRYSRLRTEIISQTRVILWWPFLRGKCVTNLRVILSLWDYFFWVNFWNDFTNSNYLKYCDGNAVAGFGDMLTHEMTAFCNCGNKVLLLFRKISTMYTFLVQNHLFRQFFECTGLPLPAYMLLVLYKLQQSRATQPLPYDLFW